MAYVRRFPWLFRRNVSEEMLKAGCSSVPLESRRTSWSADRLLRPRGRFSQMQLSTPKGEPSTLGCSLTFKLSRLLRSEFAEVAQHEAYSRLTDPPDRKKRAGMWSQNARSFESPAEYKKRTAKD